MEKEFLPVGIVVVKLMASAGEGGGGLSCFVLIAEIEGLTQNIRYCIRHASDDIRLASGDVASLKAHL
jgi:hypothetical protein